MTNPSAFVPPWYLFVWPSVSLFTNIFNGKTGVLNWNLKLNGCFKPEFYFKWVFLTVIWFRKPLFKTKFYGNYDQRFESKLTEANFKQTMNLKFSINELSVNLMKLSFYRHWWRKHGRAAHNSKGLILVGVQRDSDYKLESSFELPKMFYARHYYIKIPVELIFWSAIHTRVTYQRYP